MNTQTHGGGRHRSLWKSPALVTALILLIPLLGNQFVEGWHWEPRGFVLFGTITFGIGLTYQLITRNMDTIAYRAAVGIALAAGFLLFWGNFVQAADDVNPSAMLYFLALPVGIIGAVIARFRPDGMARALFATALAQVLILAIVLMQNPPITAWTAASVNPGNCVDAEPSDYCLDSGCSARVWCECVFRRAVWRIGVVVSDSVSDSRAWGVSTTSVIENWMELRVRRVARFFHTPKTALASPTRDLPKPKAVRKMRAFHSSTQSRPIH